MSDFSRGWRSSANLQVAPPNDPLRRVMMTRAIYEPAESRIARGAPVVSAEQADLIAKHLGMEQNYATDGMNWFGDRRTSKPRVLGPPADGIPQQPPGRPLAPLGAQSFVRMNDDAMSDAAIGGLLQGHGPPLGGFLGTLGHIGGVSAGASPLEHLGPTVPFGPSTGWQR